MPSVAPSPTLTQTCALCGLPARAPVTLDPPTSEAAPVTFCCNGCRNVWRILEESGQLAAWPRPPRLAPLPAGRPARPGRPPRRLTLCLQPVPPRRRRHRLALPRKLRPADEYGAIDDVRECTLRLDGMWCSSCAWLIAETLRRKRGVVSASVSFATDSARIAYQARPPRRRAAPLRSSARSATPPTKPKPAAKP